MSRGWESQDEKSYWIPDCDIEGKIPLDIHGSLIRNGPGINEVYGKKLKHPIDGDGMVCKLTLYDEKVHFHSKFVSSFHRKAEAKENTFIFPGQMGTRIHSIAADTLNAFKAVFYGSKPNLKFRNPSNTNSLYWGGKDGKYLKDYQELAELTSMVLSPTDRFKLHNLGAVHHAGFMGHESIMADEKIRGME
ncbi:apocarotenoid-15,15'-oxygenase isoform X2 [Hydra vulgaris]|uniref:apocarotenoid-15,15'-oxygenase isoform X2 n=1 Tax=Hydra vulgaris TaxID=6087 RepID=UPI001F5FD1DC|nr:apocarotenoid-15,15'-oxygenase-like isoform X2 [Hydra vulgaris]